MNVPDVNVLLSLFRPDHVQHEAATAWWRRSAEASEPFAVPDLVWVGFVRVATNRRIFEEAATVADAWQFVETLTALPSYYPALVADGALTQFARLAHEIAASGNIVTDAYIAGAAVACGGTVVTFDRGFRRFDGLRVTELVA